MVGANIPSQQICLGTAQTCLVCFVQTACRLIGMENPEDKKEDKAQTHSLLRCLGKRTDCEEFPATQPCNKLGCILQ